LSNYSGDAFVSRDSRAFIFDWDDTLFPTTWMLEDVGDSSHFDRPRLQRLPEVRRHYAKMVNLLSAASALGHVFIVTASQRAFVRNSCFVLFPEMVGVLEELNVTVLYSRNEEDPRGGNDLAGDKTVMFDMALRHQRPMPPQLSRFYRCEAEFPAGHNWNQVFVIGDATSDMAAGRAVLNELDVHQKLFKLKGLPTITQLTDQLDLLLSVLPHAANKDCSLFMELFKGEEVVKKLTENEPKRVSSFTSITTISTAATEDGAFSRNTSYGSFSDIAPDTHWPWAAPDEIEIEAV
jgi:phosphoglycolate phosphatase-like HAD superfamily hydrolase